MGDDPAVGLVAPGMEWLGMLLPGTAQAIIGVLIVRRQLHKHNIYFTNPQLWAAIDLSHFDLKEISKTETSTTPSHSPQSHAPSNVSASTTSSTPITPPQAITIDRSGDQLRLQIILAALAGLGVFLFYQYVLSSPEKISGLENRVNQVISNYTEAEAIPETSTLPLE